MYETVSCFFFSFNGTQVLVVEKYFLYVFQSASENKIG